VNNRVADLKHVVNCLSKRMEQLFGDHSKHQISDYKPMIEHPDPDPKLGLGKKVTDPAHLVSTSHEASPSQFGHHYETQQWSAVF
jgi:hypothetical protein